MAGQNSRWLKGNERYSKKARESLDKFTERAGFRNGAKISPPTGEKANG